MPIVAAGSALPSLLQPICLARQPCLVGVLPAHSCATPAPCSAPLPPERGLTSLVQCFLSCLNQFVHLQPPLCILLVGGVVALQLHQTLQCTLNTLQHSAQHSTAQSGSCYRHQQQLNWQIARSDCTLDSTRLYKNSSQTCECCSRCLTCCAMATAQW